MTENHTINYVPPTPENVEQLIETARLSIEKFAVEVNLRRETRILAKTALKRAEARARVQLTSGTVADRDAAVFLATEAERDAYDVAEIAYGNAVTHMRVLEKSLLGYMGINKSVSAAYMGQGRGR